MLLDSIVKPMTSLIYMLIMKQIMINWREGRNLKRNGVVNVKF